MRVRATSGLMAAVCLLFSSACGEERGDAREVESTEQGLYPLTTQLWPQDKPIPVCWTNPTSDNAEARSWVASAVQGSWERYANVRFTGWGPCSAETNFSGVSVGVFDGRPSAILGAQGAGIPNSVILNFTYANYNTEFCTPQREFCIRADAIHEFGHVLGFAHEQNRPDKEPCDQEEQGADGNLKFGPYDLRSVMNYCNPSFVNGGQLSDSDIAGVRALYGTRKLQQFGLNESAGGWHVDIDVRTQADVNDDERADIIGFGGTGVYVSLSNGVGFAPSELFMEEFGYDQGWRIDQHPRLLGDVNADGRADIVGFGNAGTYLSLSGSNRFYPTTLLGDFGYEQGWRVDQHTRVLADVDGDGRKDIVGFGNAGVYVAFGQGASFAAPQFLIADFGYDSGWRNDKHVRTTADVDGDGRDDVVGFGDAGVYVALSTGSGFSQPQLFFADFGYVSGWRIENHLRVMADVNADRRADIVAFGDLATYVSLSGGSRFYPWQELNGFAYGSGWSVQSHPRVVADVTGDGRADIVGFGDSGVIVSMSLGGASFAGPEIWALRYATADAKQRLESSPNLFDPREFVRTAGDVNGDGRQDVIGFAPDGVHTTDLAQHLMY